MIIEKKSFLKQALEQCSSMQKFDEFNIEKRLVITTSDMGSGDDDTEKLTVINVKNYDDDLNAKNNNFNELILKPEVARIVNNANDPHENNNINASKLTAEELLNIWMKRTITSSSKSANKTSLVDVPVRPKSQSTENESLLPKNRLDDDVDDNSDGKDSVCHSTHITSDDHSPKKPKSKKKAKSQKFHLISTNIDHPYCNLSKPDEITTKKTLKKSKQPQVRKRRIKRKATIKKTTIPTAKIVGGNISKRSNKSHGFLKSKNPTIVPIKVEFNEINGESNSKILVLNDFNSNAIINSLNLFGSKFEPKMSTMVRDTTVRYINDKQKTSNNFDKSMLYNWDNDVGMASQFVEIHDPTFAFATLPSVQTILSDTPNQHPSIPSRNFEDADIAYGKVQINEHNIDYFTGSFSDEDNNLSEDKWLPYGYCYNVDENDFNQSISSLTFSNVSPPVLNGIESFNIQNNQNNININNFPQNKNLYINDDIVIENNIDDGYNQISKYLITPSMLGNDQMLSNNKLPTIKYQNLPNIISHKKSKLPMNNKIPQELTLAQLNSPNLAIKEEEGGISDTWAPMGLDENVMDDVPLEVDSFSRPQQSGQSHQAQNDSQQLEQSIVTDSSQMFPINTSIINSSFVMQDQLPRMFSSPQFQLQGQSNFRENDQSTLLNHQFVRNNSRSVDFSEFVPYNSRTVNHLVSKPLPNTSMMTHPELISNPLAENPNDDNSKFNIPCNSGTTLSPPNIDHVIGNHNNQNANTNNRIRNNSLSTSCDEGFAEDDFDESDKNSERSISNHNNVLTENLIEGQVFLMNDPQNGPQISNVQATNNELIKEEISDGIWSYNDQQQQQPQVLSQITMNDQRMFCEPNSSSFSAIDENEESDEEDDDSFYGNYDASDLIGATISDDINNKWSINMGRSRKGNDKRHFWQYNVQSKGPKGPRIGTASLGDEDDDPHVFKDIADPVFSPDCPVEGVKHSGKARRGDGNDLTANPKKLLMIGLELKKLSKVINDLTPVTEVPTVSRNESRKEKNKLASRACRLKKKAQHEANKIKLHGLYSEHCKLVKLIEKYRQLIKMAIECLRERKKPFTIEIGETSQVIKSFNELDTIFSQLKATTTLEIAGKTADFVNLILDNVTQGIPEGGINNY